MRAALLLAALVFSPCLWPEDAKRLGAPSYSIDSIANSASHRAGHLAPNTFATIYGVDLSYITRTLSASDIGGGGLPTVLGGVQLTVGNWPAPLLYISPKQINFVVPYVLIAGDVDVQLIREGTAGPKVRIRLLEAAPAAFQLDTETAIASHADGSLITSEAPAQSGEVIVVYATGLGRTAPDQANNLVAFTAATLRRVKDLVVLLNGQPVAAGRIEYAGVTPGYAGLYQINLRLPEQLDANPEIRIALGPETSPSGLKLPTR